MYRVNERAVVFLPWNTIEPEAQQQILNTAKMPFIFKHVAVMPDCHYGKGATVGTVLATKGAVIPAAVGVDIGCGMIAVRTPLTRTDIPQLSTIRSGIERAIPMSAGRNNLRITPTAAERIGILEKLASDTKATPDDYDRNWRLALGTLGGGNRIGNHYIRIAQKLCDKLRVDLPDRDLAYLPDDHPAFTEYLRDLNWAQQFALHNRNEMMDRVLTEVSRAVSGSERGRRGLELQRINSHHNFTQQEDHFGARVWITRKGAIKATKDSWAMIPGSMGTRSYIVVGKENPMSFHSAPHGAGRRYSRTKARKLFTMNDLNRAMEGIEYRRSGALLDEIPGAYKDIDQVMENAHELVETKFVLKQFINVKGD